MSAILILASLAAGASPERCRRIHHLADGRVVETTVSAGDGGASASATASGGRSSSASASARSSSSSGGATSTATSVTTVDGVRRSTTVRRDAAGCTVTVDDRPIKE